MAAILNLAGAVALLLWGVHMVQSGLQRAFRARLHAMLAVALRHRLRAFCAGLGVTAALQSSTATGFMATSFMAAGLVGLVPALALMFGANVGTTLIVQAVAFPVTMAAPVLLVGGVLLFGRPQRRLRAAGRVFVGLGLMLLSLDLLSAATAPLQHLPLVALAAQQVEGQPALALVVGMLLAWAAHSSVAIVLLLASLAAHDLLSMPAAMAMVLGANLGTSLNPLFEGASRRSRAACRLPVGNLLARAVGAIILLPLLQAGPMNLPLFIADPGRQLALFHLFFNLGLSLVMLPLLGPYARLLLRLIPDRPLPDDPCAPKYLADSSMPPILLLDAAAREALRMSDALDDMLRGVRQALATDDHDAVASARRAETVAQLARAIKHHLTALDQRALTSVDHVRAERLLAFAVHIDLAGNLVDRCLLSIVAKRIKRGLALPDQAQADLLALVDRLRANARVAAGLLLSGDRRSARLLAEEKQAFRAQVAESVAGHFRRLRDGDFRSVETSSLHLALINTLKHVNGHLIEAAAYPVLERCGELLASRLRPIETVNFAEHDPGRDLAGTIGAGDTSC